MKIIGLIFGDEVNFSNSIKNYILNKTNDIIVESLKLDIVVNDFLPHYTVILDRFSFSFPFYNYAMNYFSMSKIKIINSSFNRTIHEDFSVLQILKQNNINVPKTAIIPSKILPHNVSGSDLHNLNYPLDWETMFNKIGFPANIKSNNSNDLFDTYRVYNKQDFFFIYEMSDTKTLLFQECIDSDKNLRLFVVGNKKLFLNYELNKAPRDRYSLFTEGIDSKNHRTIEKIIDLINDFLMLDMYIVDIAINNKSNKTYFININQFNMNIDNLYLPQNVYDWLVENTSELIISFTNSNKDEIITKKTMRSPKVASNKIKTITNPNSKKNI